MARRFRRHLAVLCACAASVIGCGGGGGGGGTPDAPPVALGDVVSTSGTTPVEIDVLANDYDARGDAITLVGVVPPDVAVGTVVQESSGALTFTAAGGFQGFAVFTYTISDPAGQTATADVVVLVDTTVTIAMTEVRGLFQPDAVGVGQYVAGYRSLDNLGRIYSNRAYQTGNPASAVWTANKQYVDFVVTVECGGATLPAGAHIVWTATDPDDPSNEATDVHAHWKSALDPNDYDGRDNDLSGTADVSDGVDNTGSRDGLAAWEQLDAQWALANTNQTSIAAGSSRVRFNATDDGGDNFTVTAGIRLASNGPMYDELSTGVMTVWKRVDVEYVKMTSSAGIPGLLDGTANAAFASCFAELVPQAGAPRAVDNVAAMGLNEYDAYVACDEYVTAAGGEFQHEGEPGWFFAAAGNVFVASGAGSTEVIFNGSVSVDEDGQTLYPYTAFPASKVDRQQTGTKTGNVSAPSPGHFVMQTAMTVSTADYFDGGMLLWGYNETAQTYSGVVSIISHTTGANIQIEYGAEAQIPVATTPILLLKEMISAAYVYDPSNVDAQVLFPYTSFSYVWSSTYNFGWFGVETKGYSTPTQYNRYVFDVIDHGFAATDYYDKAAQVYSTGALVISGISPGPNGGLEGRTIVFTGDGGDLNTLTHEFGHAFGFHHICGNWEYRSFGSGAACTMHYNWYLMLNLQIERRPALYVYPDTDSPRFCTDHIKAIRTQNLEGVAKLGWSD